MPLCRHCHKPTPKHQRYCCVECRLADRPLRKTDEPEPRAATVVQKSARPTPWWSE